MSESIREFVSDYAIRYAGGVEEFLLGCGRSLFRRVTLALQRPQSTIFIFGNGGSYALAKCLKYSIEEYAVDLGIPVRVHTGVDLHQLTSRVDQLGSGIRFTDTLMKRGANRDDLIILISGSGNSENLCDVARLARTRSIETIGILGSAKGQLTEVLDPEYRFITRDDDQQLSEDIMQSLCLAFETRGGVPVAECGPTVIRNLAFSLGQSLSEISVRDVDRVGASIVESFVSQRPVWVLGLGHPVLSLCAEHVAHNLYWDGIYQVEDAPPRIIFSTPTAANLTGIANDRRSRVLAELMGFDSRLGGIALVFGLDADKSLNQLSVELKQKGIDSFFILGTGDLGTSAFHKTGLISGFAHGSVVQALGHLLGRVIRMKLLQSSSAFDPSQPEADFLINEDLAQRRLVDV